MQILVVGSGGREHALAWKLKQSSRVRKVFVAPGNGGTARECENVAIAANDIEGLAHFAEHQGIDLTVVGPEAPLALGIGDLFAQKKLPLFGPRQTPSRLESSKIFAKEIMAMQGIVTAPYEVFTADTLHEALAHVETRPLPLVVKAEGLAAGKGVQVCHTRDQALAAVSRQLKDQPFGEASQRIIIEDCLRGPEASFLAFVDGKHILPMDTSEDHKRVYDGDKGPNTGGMGAYSPSAFIPQALKERIVRDVFTPLVQGMEIMGEPYTGMLYAGLIIHEQTPYVLEFNVRFGDPETQPLLLRLQTDLVDLMEKTMQGRLHEQTIAFDPQPALTVVLASGGYPGSYAKNLPIQGLPLDGSADVKVFHAGTRYADGRFYTSGGRVLGVTAKAQDIAACRKRAYAAAGGISFKDRYMRTDIGVKALSQKEAGDEA